MHRAKRPECRNKLDLGNRAQVRLMRRRLRLSEAELAAIVGRIGNSIAAISKEVALQRGQQLKAPAATAPIVEPIKASPAAVETAAILTRHVDGPLETTATC